LTIHVDFINLNLILDIQKLVLLSFCQLHKKDFAPQAENSKSNADSANSWRIHNNWNWYLVLVTQERLILAWYFNLVDYETNISTLNKNCITKMQCEALCCRWKQFFLQNV